MQFEWPKSDNQKYSDLLVKIDTLLEKATEKDYISPENIIKYVEKISEPDADISDHNKTRLISFLSAASGDLGSLETLHSESSRLQIIIDDLESTKPQNAKDIVKILLDQSKEKIASLVAELGPLVADKLTGKLDIDGGLLIEELNDYLEQIAEISQEIEDVEIEVEKPPYPVELQEISTSNTDSLRNALDNMTIAKDESRDAIITMGIKSGAFEYGKPEQIEQYFSIVDELQLKSEGFRAKVGEILWKTPHDLHESKMFIDRENEKKAAEFENTALVEADEKKPEKSQDLQTEEPLLEVTAEISEVIEEENLDPLSMAVDQIMDVIGDVERLKYSMNLTNNEEFIKLGGRVEAHIFAGTMDILRDMGIDSELQRQTAKEISDSYNEILMLQAKLENANIQIDPNYNTPSLNIGETTKYIAGAELLNAHLR